ncbi:peptidoglycan-associated lipoprotein [Filimonas sp.]|nr:peptidoglycan-associated lipoprotein [Filimonas sp.]
MKYFFAICCFLYVCSPIKAQERQYTVLFEFNKSDIPDSSMLGMMKILARASIDRVLIEGHCDSIGSKVYNRALSEKRANEVMKLLTQNGIERKAIRTCIGYGEEQPLKPNDSEADRQLNRRVVVHFFMKEAEKPEVVGIVKKPQKEDFKAGRSIILKDLLFYGARHILKPESIPSLQHLAGILKENPTIKIEIQGHVCCTTTEPDGFDIDTGLDNLSVARAEMVYIYLVHKSGIDKKRLSYKGFGGTQKITQVEDTEAQQQINRRVEIKVMEE